MKLDIFDYFFSCFIIIILSGGFFRKTFLLTACVSVVYLTAFYIHGDFGIVMVLKSIIYLSGFWVTFFILEKMELSNFQEASYYKEQIDYYSANIKKMSQSLENLKLDEQRLKKGYETELELSETLISMSRALEFDNVLEIFTQRLHKLLMFDVCEFLLVDVSNQIPKIEMRRAYPAGITLGFAGWDSLLKGIAKNSGGGGLFYDIQDVGDNIKAVVFTKEIINTVPALLFSGLNDSYIDQLRPLLRQFYFEIERSRLFEQIKNMSTIDSVTNLYQRRYFMSLVNDEYTRALNKNFPFSIMMMDIDDFKQYNDKYGHLAGDYILREIGKIMLDSIRKNDIAARYGGEEFIFYIDNSTPQSALSVAERVLGKVRRHQFIVNGDILNVTVSVGIACYTNNSASLYDIISKADRNLYYAKETGKNKICF